MQSGLAQFRRSGWRFACAAILTYVLVLQSLFLPFQKAQAQGLSGIDAALKALCLNGAETGNPGEGNNPCKDMPCCLPSARHDVFLAVAAVPPDFSAFEFKHAVNEAWHVSNAYFTPLAKSASPLQPRAPPLYTA